MDQADHKYPGSYLVSVMLSEFFFLYVEQPMRSFEVKHIGI